MTPLFTYFSAGARLSPGDEQWIDHAEATETGAFIILVSVGILLALCVPFYLVWWRRDALGEGYVPDSAPLTLTFCGALLSAHTYRPAASR